MGTSRAFLGACLSHAAPRATPPPHGLDVDSYGRFSAGGAGGDRVGRVGRVGRNVRTVTTGAMSDVARRQADDSGARFLRRLPPTPPFKIRAPSSRISRFTTALYSSAAPSLSSSEVAASSSSDLGASSSSKPPDSNLDSNTERHVPDEDIKRIAFEFTLPTGLANQLIETGGLRMSVNGLQYAIDPRPGKTVQRLMDAHQEELGELEAELVPVAQRKADIDHAAYIRTKRIVWGALGYLFAQSVVVFKLTFFSRFGWDVMEPIVSVENRSALFAKTAVKGVNMLLYFHNV